VTFKRR